MMTRYPGTKTRKIVPIICKNCGAVRGIKEESGKITCEMCGVSNVK